MSNWHDGYLNKLKLILRTIAISLVTCPTGIAIAGQLAGSAPLVASPNLLVFTWPQTSISMKPTILPGEKISVDKAYFLNHQISRGDLVVVLIPGGSGVLQIKRVVGIAGDDIKIVNGSLMQNGKRENTAGYTITPFADLSQYPGNSDLFNKPAIKFPHGYVYVLGDHRPAALDSRIWGAIKVDTIVGKPISIIWSSEPNRIGKKLL